MFLGILDNFGLYFLFFFQAGTSLNTNECFVLHSGSSVFIWQGKQSSVEQQQLALKIAEFLKVCSLQNITFMPRVKLTYVLVLISKTCDSGGVFKIFYDFSMLP